MNEKIISLETIRENLKDIFRQLQKEVLGQYKEIEYKFYHLVIDNWEKVKPEIEQESDFDDNLNRSDNSPKRTNSPNNDGLFYM